MSAPIHSLYEPVDIDSTRIEILPGDLFAFQVTLSGSPDVMWRKTFDQVWKESRYLGKLDALVLENSIRFVCRQDQGIEAYLYLIESRVEATNEQMRVYWESQGICVERIKHQQYPASYIPLGGTR